VIVVAATVTYHQCINLSLAMEIRDFTWQRQKELLKNPLYSPENGPNGGGSQHFWS